MIVRLLSLLLLAFLLVSTSNAQEDALISVGADLDRLLPAGVYAADIMDSTAMSPRRAALTEKFTAAAKKNMKWSQHGLDHTSRTGTAPPYSTKSGLTTSEWKEFQTLLKDHSDMRSVSSGTERIEVKREGAMIRFSATGRLSFLDGVEIDTAANVMRIGTTEMQCIQRIEEDSAEAIIRAARHGYRWQHATGLGADADTHSDHLAALDFTDYDVTIGRLDATGAVYMNVRIDIFDEGEFTVSIDKPFVFRARW